MRAVDQLKEEGSTNVTGQDVAQLTGLMDFRELQQSIQDLTAAGLLRGNIEQELGASWYELRLTAAGRALL